MAGMGIDGLVSGLDTTALISQLMQIEAMPQAALKSKVTSTQSFITAMQALNTKVASLAGVATKAATTQSWGAVSAASSAGSVTATTSAGAQASSLSFTVDKLATSQVSVSDKVATLEDLLGSPLPATITVATGTGASATATVVDLAGVADLAGFAAKLNDSDAGLSASIVKVSETESRLQISAHDTGVAAAFDLFTGTVAEADIRSGAATGAFITRDSAAVAASEDRKSVV